MNSKIKTLKSSNSSTKEKAADSKKESKKSNWSADAEFRIQNRKWLDYSGKIARRILTAIKDDGELTQAELARKLDISPQQISKIVKGQENLTLETIAKLSDALNVDLISFPDYKHSKEIILEEETDKSKAARNSTSGRKVPA